VHRMNQLRKVVSQYVLGGLDLPAFRDVFVRDFLTTKSAAPSVWPAVLEIESALGDYSEGFVKSEVELKYQLANAVRPVYSPLSVAVFVSEFDFDSSISDQSSTPDDMILRTGALNFGIPAQTDMKPVGAAGAA